MLNIVVLVSGGGSNLQALLDSEIENGKIIGVISSNPNAYALERAKNHHVPSYVINPKDFSSRTDFDSALIDTLKELSADLIVLAGFMFVLSERFCKAFEGKIINVHPSLIPAFCGDGYYGLKVHKAVLDADVKITGATVHFVNEITDGGRIILQKAVEVKEGDTPEILQKRVMEEAEWKILPQAVSQICKERSV